MSTLSDASQGNIGWVYPPQPQRVFIEDIDGIISGTTALVSGQDYIDVSFGSSQPSSDWVPLEMSIFNILDLTPVNVWLGVVTSKLASGFRLQLNGVPDSDNYYLSWSIRGVFGYYLSGPSSGRIGVPSSNFTVRLPDESTMTGAVVITPSDGGAGGTFTPSSVSLTTAAPVATFTYTPSTYGARSIFTTNDRGLSNPAQIGFVSVASTYTLSGPNSGSTGQPSTPFTVALPVGGAVAGTVTVTPNDGGGGGTFTPSTVSLTTGAPSATFTYTPASVGAKTISVTNDGGLTNPAPITYTANAAFQDNFTGSGLITAHTADTGQTWARLHTGGSALIQLGSGSAYGSSSGGDEDIANYTPPSADQDATITVLKGSITGSPEIGIWLRSFIDATNPRGYMGRYVEGSGFQFYRLDSGFTFVQVGSNTAGSLANNDTLKFSVSGTGATITLTLFKNGVQVAQVTDASGNRITSNGKVGIHLFDPTDGAGNYRIDSMIA